MYNLSWNESVKSGLMIGMFKRVLQTNDAYCYRNDHPLGLCCKQLC